jgi:hypothetical protein
MTRVTQVTHVTCVTLVTPWTTSVLFATLVALGGCDPVHDDAIAALGPEAAGVRRGPLHRPGQPCLLCHDGAIGDPQRFTVAGTVYETPGGLVAVAGISVVLIDANTSQAELQVNEAGNFYATPSQYDPTFPIQVFLRAQGGQAVRMQTLIEGNGTVEPNGSCASCHLDPAGRNSPGHVCVKLDDGGTPP